MKKKVVGLGEVLWDVLPERKCLGGAPANFSYIATLMGDEGIVASRVGEDSLGVEALCRMRELGLTIDHVQKDRNHATGTVNVELDSAGLARYQIAHPAAWDFLEWTAEWRGLAAQADAVCFGSLAQRDEESRSTIRRFVEAAAPTAVVIFDANLRQSYYSREVLAESMSLADIVKLNDEELPKVMTSHGISHENEQASAQWLLGTYQLEMVCITRGGRGSLLLRGGEASEHSGFRVRVADTVGSGDAFTAGLMHQYMQGAPLDRMNEVANRMGAWVASKVGATPTLKGDSLKELLAQIG